MSETLSQTHLNYAENGNRLNDDSKSSENSLSEAMKPILAYARYIFRQLNIEIEYRTSMSLYECQEFFHRQGGPKPNIKNKKVFMKPDGGIILGKKANGEVVPLLIIEDKVQGTNDNLYFLGKKKQSCGNAIERGGKNIRGASMLFIGLPYFSYVLFAAGCDFHHSHTISKRIEMMNYGIPNHYIEVTEDDYDISSVIESINVSKKLNLDTFSCFIKAHKWDKMQHNSSLWKMKERIDICKRVLDLVHHEFILHELYK